MAIDFNHQPPTIESISRTNRGFDCVTADVTFRKDVIHGFGTPTYLRRRIRAFGISYSSLVLDPRDSKRLFSCISFSSACRSALAR